MPTPAFVLDYAVLHPALQWFIAIVSAIGGVVLCFLIIMINRDPRIRTQLLEDRPMAGAISRLLIVRAPK